MNDRDAILALMGEYCDSIDRGDLAGCAALFADGAWGIEGDLAHGADAVMAVLDNVTLYDGRPMTRHLMSNVHITVDGDGARAQSCITVMQGLEDFPLQAIFIGTYFDSFEQREGQWIWRERRIVPDLVGDLSRHRGDMASS
ncbi:MAG: nuclear transport factor 2 family protein [Pseudomonadota bacterium]